MLLLRAKLDGMCSACRHSRVLCWYWLVAVHSLAMQLARAALGMASDKSYATRARHEKDVSISGAGPVGHRADWVPMSLSVLLCVRRGGEAIVRKRLQRGHT